MSSVQSAGEAHGGPVRYQTHVISEQNTGEDGMRIWSAA